MHERRESLTQRDRLFIVEDGHGLPITPHRCRAANQAVARPLTRLLKVVARKQRGAARAEMMASAGIEWVSAAGNGALQAVEIGHALHYGMFYFPSRSVSFFDCNSSICLMCWSVSF